MKQLRDMDLTGATVVEHRSDGPKHGRLEYSGINGDGSFGVGWSSPHNRTTLFKPSTWACDVIKGVVFLRRTGEDAREFDIPWPDANLYTIIPKKEGDDNF